MFKKKTVFILGAGASWHYGYPTGEELVTLVWEKAHSIREEYGKFNGDGKAALAYTSAYPRNFKFNFMEAFFKKLEEIQLRIAQANPLVIDDFLGRNAGIADVGKLLIAMVLFDCGKLGKIRSGNTDVKARVDAVEGNWIRYVIQQLTINCEKPENLLDNHVSFVTFNYDLSLEYHLCRALKNYEWFTEGGVSDRFFSEERFHHVYGQLYKFDPANPFPPRGSYGNSDFPLADEIDRAHDAAQTIRTISPYEKVAFPEAVRAIAEADYLYFLGYGFDRRNNELLGLGTLSDTSNTQDVYFTNYGNSNKISKSVEKLYVPLQHVLDPNGVPLGSLLGDHYQKRSRPGWAGPKFRCEKSTKSVYDALAEDFDWPE